MAACRVPQYEAVKLAPHVWGANWTCRGLYRASYRSRGMIRLGGRSRRGPPMTTTPDSTLADPRRSKADLQRENAELRRTLDEALHERDEALQRETATAEVLQVIN